MAYRRNVNVISEHKAEFTTLKFKFFKISFLFCHRVDPDPGIRSLLFCQLRMSSRPFFHFKNHPCESYASGSSLQENIRNSKIPILGLHGPGISSVNYNTLVQLSYATLFS